MAELTNELIPEQVNDLFFQLKSKIDVVDTQIGQILQVHENEFLNAYRIHMIDIQKEIQILKFNISQEELKRRRDAEIIIREKERDWFRDEALRLNKVCKEYMKSTEVWKSKAKLLEEDKKLLEDKLRILTKKSEANKSETKKTHSQSISPLKIQEPSKSFITDSAATLNIKPDYTAETTISHLKSELHHYKTQLKQMRSESTTLIAKRHQLENLFEECIQLAREDSNKSAAEDRKLMCSEYEDLLEPERRKLLYILLSKPEVSELLKSFVFRTRRTVTPSKYLQRNSTSSHGLKNHVFSTPKRQSRVRYLPYYN